MAFTATTATSAAAWRPDIYTFAPQDVVPILYMQVTTIAGQVQGDAPSVRCAYVDDASAAFVAEGIEIDESEPNLAEVVVYTAKASQLVRLSNEQFSQPETSQQLAASVARAIIRRTDVALLSEADPNPATAPATGLLNVASVVDGGEIADSLDGLVDLISTLQTNLSSPSHIVVGPAGWAELRKLKTAAGWNTSLIGGRRHRQPADVAELACACERRPHRLRRLSPRQKQHRRGGRSNAPHDAYFKRTQLRRRRTWSVGHKAVRPTRLGKFTVTPAGS